MRWVGHVARKVGRGVLYKVWLEKPEGKGPLERPRRRWEDYITMNIKKVGCGSLDWIDLAQDRDR